MKKIVSLSIFFFTFGIQSCTYAEVFGEINPKFNQDFPHKLLVVMPIGSGQKEVAVNLLGYFRDKKFILMDAKEAYKCKEDYVLVDISDKMSWVQKLVKKTCVPEVFYRGDAEDVLSQEVLTEVSKFADIDGLLLVEIYTALPWILDPFMGWSNRAKIVIYDARTGEWAYRLGFWCVFFFQSCAITTDSVATYLESDLHKKFRKIKFR